MRWFYSIRGRSKDHGLVEESALIQMARSGRLAHDDLVRPESGGTWIRAGTLDSLFPPEPPAPVEEPKRAEPMVVRQAEYKEPERIDDAEAEDDEKEEDDVRESRPPVLLLVVVMLCIVAGAYVVVKVLPRRSARALDTVSRAAVVPDESSGQDLNGKTQAVQVVEDTTGEVADASSPESVPPQPVQEDWGVTVGRIIESIDRGDADRAQELLDETIARTGENEDTTRLAGKLSDLRREQEHYAALKRDMKAGVLDAKSAAVLVKLHGRGWDSRPLADYATEVLSQKSVSADTALSVFRTARVLGDAKVMGKAASLYAGVMPGTLSYATCTDMWKTLEQSGLNKEASGVLKAFVTVDPKCAPAWLELAALQASSGDKEGALSSLKSAISNGDDDTKKAALEDKRFDKIRRNSKFRKLTRL